MLPAIASGSVNAATSIAADGGGALPVLSAAAATGGDAALELVQLMVYQLSTEASAQLVQESLATLGRLIDVRA